MGITLSPEIQQLLSNVFKNTTKALYSHESMEVRFNGY